MQSNLIEIPLDLQVDMEQNEATYLKKKRKELSDAWKYWDAKFNNTIYICMWVGPLMMFIYTGIERILRVRLDLLTAP